jgi:hypothetical protein
MTNEPDSHTNPLDHFGPNGEPLIAGEPMPTDAELIDSLQQAAKKSLTGISIEYEPGAGYRLYAYHHAGRTYDSLRQAITADISAGQFRKILGEALSNER